MHGYRWCGDVAVVLQYRLVTRDIGRLLLRLPSPAIRSAALTVAP